MRAFLLMASLSNPMLNLLSLLRKNQEISDSGNKFKKTQ